MHHPWFCDDRDGEGTTWHPTQEAALAHAATCIAAWRHQEANEWPEAVEDIVVGCVSHRATQVNLRACTEEDSGEDEGYSGGDADDYSCDVAMRPLDAYGQDRSEWLQQHERKEEC
mgnify:CR=1 FL=1